MKFKVNDKVIVTSGKDKGRKSRITRVLPKEDKVIVEGANMYTRHWKKMYGQPGRVERKERPLATAKIAIINDKGEPDRIGWSLKDGVKVRIYKKTKTVIEE